MKLVKLREPVRGPQCGLAAALAPRTRDATHSVFHVTDILFNSIPCILTKGARGETKRTTNLEISKFRDLSLDHSWIWTRSLCFRLKIVYSFLQHYGLSSSCRPLWKHQGWWATGCPPHTSLRSPYSSQMGIEINFRWLSKHVLGAFRFPH